MRREHLAQGVLALDFDRPDRGNALTAALVEELIAAVAEACTDPALHTLVLQPSGAHFCTGFDLSALDSESDADLLHRFVRVEMLLSALWHAPVRTIACAQGRTWGAGADLFAACDLRAAATGASFCFPGAGFGLVLGTRRLAERVGPDLARGLTTEGKVLDQTQALAAGLVTDIVEGDTGSWLLQHCKAPAVDRETGAALRSATRADLRDADLAALVRSAARPGLKERIVAYRQRMAAESARRAAR